MHTTSLSHSVRIGTRTRMFNGMLTLASTIATAGAAGTAANASFTNYTFVATPITVSGQNLVRYEVFATFNGPTDTVLNVFNFALVSTADPDGQGQQRRCAGHAQPSCGNVGAATHRFRGQQSTLRLISFDRLDEWRDQQLIG